jgi:hypothetical protein
MRAVESLKEDPCWPGSETRPGARNRRHFNPAQAAIEALDEGILLWQARFGAIGPEEAAADFQCVSNPFSSVARTKLGARFLARLSPSNFVSKAYKIQQLMSKSAIPLR